MSNPSPPAHGGGILINRTIPEMERETVLNRLASTNSKMYYISDADLSIF